MVYDVNRIVSKLHGILLWNILNDSQTHLDAIDATVIKLYAVINSIKTNWNNGNSKSWIINSNIFENSNEIIIKISKCLCVCVCYNFKHILELKTLHTTRILFTKLKYFAIPFFVVFYHSVEKHVFLSFRRKAWNERTFFYFLHESNWIEWPNKENNNEWETIYWRYILKRNTYT